MHVDTRRLLTPKKFGHNFLLKSITIIPGELYYHGPTHRDYPLLLINVELLNLKTITLRSGKVSSDDSRIKDFV